MTKSLFHEAARRLTSKCSVIMAGLYRYTAHTHTMETHSMEKVPSMENFSINQTE